jgi:oligopeptide transport system permease protein
MLGYAIRRLASALPTLLAIVTAAFFLMRLAPGGPFDDEQTLAPEVAANLDAAYGLDQPVLVQYRNYLGGLLRGDLGPSFRYKDFDVSELIAQGLPVTASLGAAALLLAVIAGVLLGMLAGQRRNRAADHVVMSAALAGIAVPNFVVAPLLALVFGVLLGWLPVGGWESGELRYAVLPVITLALPFVAYIARLTRGSLLEVLQSPHIRTARAKGPPRIADPLASRVQANDPPGRELPGARSRRASDRLTRRGAGIRPAGRRPLFRPGRGKPRLHARDGHGCVLRGAHHGAQPAVDLVYGWLDPRIRHE